MNDPTNPIMASFQQIQEAQIFHLEYQNKINEERIRHKDEQIAKLMLENEFKDHEINDLKKQLEAANNQVQRANAAAAAAASNAERATQQLTQFGGKKPPPMVFQQQEQQQQVPPPLAARFGIDDLDSLPILEDGLPQTNLAGKKRVPVDHVMATAMGGMPGNNNSLQRRYKKQKTGKSWQAYYEELVQCKKNEGWSAKRLKEERPDLYEWQCEQRDSLNGKTDPLTRDQTEKLRLIGIKVDNRPRKVGKQHTPWEERFEQLKEFVAEHGHTRVTQADNMPLSNWVGTMRKAYKKAGRGDKSPTVLTPNRFAKLQSIGFEWEIKAAGNGDTWERRFNELLQYKAEHGTAHIPRADNTKLHAWCKFQRKKYNRIQKGEARGLLSEERVARLTAIGFPWRLGKAQFEYWNDMNWALDASVGDDKSTRRATCMNARIMMIHDE